LTAYNSWPFFFKPFGLELCLTWTHNKPLASWTRAITIRLNAGTMPWFKSLMWTYTVLQVEESLKEPGQNSIPFRHTVFTENVFATKWNRCMHLLLADCTHISCCKYLHITPPTIVSSWTLVISFGMYQPHRQGATKVCRMCVQPLHNPEPFCQSWF